MRSFRLIGREPAEAVQNRAERPTGDARLYAAEALHLTPSAVSQQIAQLEEEAGVQLAERVGRGNTADSGGVTHC